MPAPANSLQIHRALLALRDGGVIACPTEAVWGLSCDPWDEAAVARLLELKGRPVAKGLILVAASMEQLAWLLDDLPEAQRSALAASWPGPNTWLVRHAGRVPPWVHGRHASVAVRVSAHPMVAGLCRAFGGPLVSTSANPAGRRPPVEAFMVRRYFGNRLDFLVPGRVGGADRPSVIRDLDSGQVLRN